MSGKVIDLPTISVGVMTNYFSLLPSTQSRIRADFRNSLPPPTRNCQEASNPFKHGEAQRIGASHEESGEKPARSADADWG